MERRSGPNADTAKSIHHAGTQRFKSKRLRRVHLPGRDLDEDQMMQGISVPNIIQAVYMGWLAGSGFFSEHLKAHGSSQAHRSRLDRSVPCQYR